MITQTTFDVLRAPRGASSGCARAVSALALALPLLSACYIVPMAPDGTPLYPLPPAAHGYTPAPAIPVGPMPASLNVRLYPANDLANQTGMLTGTVTNMMTGRGRFQFNYQGELLAGEASRLSGDDRKGIANAYGPRGTYASCEYQMHTATQGAGSCNFSNGAKYQVHIGG